MADCDDHHILAEVRRGNARAFGSLVDGYKDRAMTLAMRLLNHRQEAEEAVQDAFVSAYRSLEQFREDSAFGTWFYRILYNGCLSRLRKRRTGVQQELLSPEALDDLHESGSLPDRQAEDRDTEAIIAEELGRLPEQYRAALTLFYVQDMKYDQIAAIMGIPLGTVKTCLFRGKQMLRKRLERCLQREVHVA